MALVHAGLGENREALGCLERGLEAHDVHLTFLPADAKWDGLRGDAGFSDLVARCRFGI
jgi:hypothetical protein